MSRIDINTIIKKIPVTSNFYRIFLEDINRAVDGGFYPELIGNRSFEDSISPVECTTEKDGYALVTNSGQRDEFNHGERLTRWLRKNEISYTPIPTWYPIQAFMEMDADDVLNIHRHTDQEVIIKLANMAEQEDMVAITLECEVADEYRCFLLTGGKIAENSFTDPEYIHDKAFVLKGAAKEFVYKVPSLSVNIRRLVKA